MRWDRSDLAYRIYVSSYDLIIWWMISFAYIEQRLFPVYGKKKTHGFNRFIGRKAPFLFLHYLSSFYLSVLGRVFYHNGFYIRRHLSWADPIWPATYRLVNIHTHYYTIATYSLLNTLISILEYTISSIMLLGVVEAHFRLFVRFTVWYHGWFFAFLFWEVVRQGGALSELTCTGRYGLKMGLWCVGGKLCFWDGEEFWDLQIYFCFCLRAILW